LMAPEGLCVLTHESKGAMNRYTTSAGHSSFVEPSVL
jgi:hypothetical protein